MLTTLTDADAAIFADIYAQLLRLCVPYWGLGPIVDFGLGILEREESGYATKKEGTSLGLQHLRVPAMHRSSAV